MDKEGEDKVSDKLKSGGEINKNFISSISAPPHLQSIAAVSIAIQLWTKSDVMEELQQGSIHYSNYEDNSSYEELEKRIVENVKASHLPFLFKFKICHFIRAIGMQMTRWFESVDTSLQEYCSLKELRQMGGSIYWTMEGSIDRIKSVEELIKSNNQENSYDSLFELACKYCLEEYISYLWERIPCEKKCAYEYIYKYSENDNVIVAYWIFTLRNEWHIMSEKLETNIFVDDVIPDFNIFQNMICWAISTGNLYAFKYFWQKMTESEKSDTNILIWLDRLAEQAVTKLGRYGDLGSVSYPYIFWILLSHLKDQKNQKDFFKSHSEIFLRSLMECWPYQKFFRPAFLELVKLDYISEDTYLTRMFDLAEKIVKGKSAEYFAEVWSVSPQELKQRFLTDNLEPNYHVRVLLYLLKIADFKTLSLVLKDASARDNREVAFFVTTSEYLQQYISSKKDLSLVDRLLKEVVPPKKSFQSFKQELISLHYDYWYEDMCLKWIRKGDIEALDKFLNWAFPTIDERENFKKDKLPFINTYILLICKGNYDNVNSFAKWYFKTEVEIPNLKNIFFQKDNDSNLEKLLHELAVQKERSSNLFYKFLNIIRFSPEETREFKRMCFNHIDDLVRASHFTFATVLLNWCYVNAKEVDRYKSKLVLFILGLKICPPYDSSMLNKMIVSLIGSKRLMEWSLPLSKEVTTEVKLSLSRDKDFHGEDLKSVNRKRDLLFRLLDCKCIGEIENISKKSRLSKLPCYS